VNLLLPKSFEKLVYIFIRDIHKYIRKSLVYVSTFFKTIINLYANRTLIEATNKYTNNIHFSLDLNHFTGIPDAIKKTADCNILNKFKVSQSCKVPPLKIR